MFRGKNKVITFSYDDGVTQDIRLIEILNKYNLKATFNLNSERLGSKNKNKPEDVKYIYEGHEVAAHTLQHLKLTEISDEKEIIRQVEIDRINLSELVQYEVFGLAYPCAPPNCDDRVADIIKNNTGIKYARSYNITQKFDLPDDFYQYEGTIKHYKFWDKFFEFGEKFINLPGDTPQIFYIWGHSFELDEDPKRWDEFDNFCKLISNKPDICYCTNIELFDMLRKNQSEGERE